MLIQWGLWTEKYTVGKKSNTVNKITFPKQFSKSCIVLTEAQNSEGGFPDTKAENITLEDFDAKIINTSNAEVKSHISWISIGV